MTQAVRVDIVSDVVCPWCVIGWRQLARASEETGVPLDVHWHPFELNPDMGPDGENLSDHVARKYGSTPEQSSGARRRIVEMGAALGFDFAYGPRTRMWNTFLAHQLIDWAGTEDKAHETNLALFESFFTRGENVSDLGVLVSTAKRVGLDPAAARRVLETRERAAPVREKQAFWVERGISGVPAMIFDRRRMVPGAQGEETFAVILRRQAAATE